MYSIYTGVFSKFFTPKKTTTTLDTNNLNIKFLNTVISEKYSIIYNLSCRLPRFYLKYITRGLYKHLVCVPHVMEYFNNN